MDFPQTFDFRIIYSSIAVSWTPLTDIDYIFNDLLSSFAASNLIPLKIFDYIYTGIVNF